MLSATGGAWVAIALVLCLNMLIATGGAWVAIA